METANQLFSVTDNLCHITPSGLDLLEGAGYDDVDLMDLILETGGVSLVARPRTQGVFFVIYGGDKAHAYAATTLECAFRKAQPFYAGGFSKPIPGAALLAA